MSRIVFVNRFYWPEGPATGQLLTDLAEELAQRGRTVIVLTSGTAELASDEVHAGVVIRRLRSPRRAKEGAIGKLFTWLCFTLGATWALRTILKPGDNLVLLTDPPLLALLVGRVARNRRSFVHHWVQDIYPELPERIQRLRGLGWLRRLRDREWRRASGIVTLGRDMAELIRSRGIAPDRIHVIPNWAPRGLLPAPPLAVAKKRAAWQIEGKFVIAYSGNFGRVHALEPILELAAALREEPGIVFLFIGQGAQEHRLREIVDQRRLENVRFESPQPRDELGVTLSAGDAHVVTLHEQCADLVFPSKYYGILAVGRPLLFVGPRRCELAESIALHGIGGVYSAADVTAMAALLRTWCKHRELPLAMGQHALALHAAATGPGVAADRWISLTSPIRPAKLLGTPAVHTS